ncbi:Ig-like domain-containing protein [Kitasatospora camelliae]|uniref:Ig-like domain-containing protein n=1 Tax=Kitasatospora camelliae TaxID=3156397 RepID=A0AAU8JX25_9ACTN
MCRQSRHRAPASVAGPVRARRGRRTVGRSAAAVLATGLLVALNAGPAVRAQQTPGTWSPERRAVLPSGLTVQLDFAPLPGVTATAAPGALAARAGRADGSGPAYADGLKAGDPAETFLVAEQRPNADGSWRTLGTLQISFSRPVRNPRLHVSGLAGTATGRSGTTVTTTRLTVTGGSPSAPSLVGRTGWSGWTVSPGDLTPAAETATPAAAPAAVEGAGTLELAGTVGTVVLRVEQRSTALSGSTTPPAALRQAYTVTLDESLGSAPQGYGTVSHLLSDLFLGQDAAGAAARSGSGPAAPSPAAPPGTGDRPLVAVDGGATPRSPWANPGPSRLQPGRSGYRGADPTLAFPAEAAIGRYYGLDVPVSAGGSPATLAGWLDFDRNGRFDPPERVQAEIPAGATTAHLEWTVPTGAASGDTWARLRIARGGTQLVGPGGFADSGQVVDQQIRLAVGAARPEISRPATGTMTADARPELRGEGAMPGAGVAVVSGDTVLCQATAAADGGWSCRPDAPPGQGTHTLVPVETTKSGQVLRGEPVRLTVKTTPPTAPVLTLPEFTNDPGLLITGLGEPGSTVAVTVAATPGRPVTELCRTAVAANGNWSCLPVENLPDGRYQPVATAVDGAGNRTDGKPVALTVDTAAPARPVLTAPAAGETLHTARPRFGGRAEAGATVTARAAGGERTTLCNAVVAADGTWNCTATRDLAEGEQALVATVTDRAGNGTAGEPVTVTVAPAAPPSPPASPTPSAAAAAPAPPVPSAPAAPSLGVPAASPSPSPSGSASAAPASGPGGSPSTRRSASPAVPSGSLSGASPRPSPPVAEAVAAAGAAVLRALDGPAARQPTSPPAPTPIPAPGQGAAVSRPPSAAPKPRDAPAGNGPAETTGRAGARPAAPREQPAGTAPVAAGSLRPGWRGTAVAGLLLLAATGLLARRVLAEGSGTRRR